MEVAVKSHTDARTTGSAQAKDLKVSADKLNATPTLISRSVPTRPGEWTLTEIQAALKRELPPTLLKTRKQGDAIITYIDWHTVNRILDKYAPGWSWEIKTMQLSADRIFLVGRLTIPAADGLFVRESTGTETLTDFGYGDPSSNAEAMCFRRAAAKFGLGLYLYEK